MSWGIYRAHTGNQAHPTELSPTAPQPHTKDPSQGSPFEVLLDQVLVEVLQL